MVAWGGRIPRHKETFGGDGYVHYLDCHDGVSQVFIHINHHHTLCFKSMLFTVYQCNSFSKCCFDTVLRPWLEASQFPLLSS